MSALTLSCSYTHVPVLHYWDSVGTEEKWACKELRSIPAQSTLQFYRAHSSSTEHTPVLQSTLQFYRAHSVYTPFYYVAFVPIHLSTPYSNDLTCAVGVRSVCAHVLVTTAQTGSTDW